MYSIKVDNHYLAWKFWIADLGLRNQVRTFLIHLLFNILYKKTRHKAWDRFSFFFLSSFSFIYTFYSHIHIAVSTGFSFHRVYRQIELKVATSNERIFLFAAYRSFSSVVSLSYNRREKHLIFARLTSLWFEHVNTKYKRSEYIENS